VYVIQSLTFKRKLPKPVSTSTPFSLPRFFSSNNADSSNPSRTSTPRNINVHRRNHSRTYNASENLNIDPDAKEPSAAADWYIEGPGRRVGYDDLTAIDWIFEYAKERQRLRILRSATSGLIGQIRQIADASQIWLVLIATGIASGLVAAFIDVASDWLADLKGGVCGNVQHGGRFYLSRGFCCWGVEELENCYDWRTWRTIFGVSSNGGGWMIEYVVFVAFSVSIIWAWNMMDLVVLINISGSLRCDSEYPRP
jgi:chloride channel 3/4/5